LKEKENFEVSTVLHFERERERDNTLRVFTLLHSERERGYFEVSTVLHFEREREIERERETTL